MKIYLNVRRFRGASAASQSRFARCVNRRGSPTLHQPDSPIVTVCAAASPGTNRANPSPLARERAAQVKRMLGGRASRASSDFSTKIG